MQIRDRIKELRRVKGCQLQPNPRNWRTHPVAQRNALRGLLAEVGYADALLARELSDGSLQLVDGHLRAETTPDAMVPVLILDIDESEANTILLTLDPLAGMAEVSTAELEGLLQDVNTDSEGVQQLIDSLTDVSTIDDFAVPETPEVNIPESYQVVVECRNEHAQEELYLRFREEGYKCRVLTL